MKEYSLADLGQAATYAADEALATLARRVATKSWHESLGISRGAWKQAHLAGEHAAAIKAAIHAQRAADAAADAKASNARCAAENLTLPGGWSSRIDGEVIVLYGPYVESLPARLKRLNAVWDHAAKAWRVPITKASSLQRVLTNAMTHADAPAQVAKRAAEKAQAIERWLGRVEEKAPTGYVYQRGVDQCHTLGIAAHPDLKERLDAAVAMASRVEAEQKAARARQYAAERTERQAAKQAARAQRDLFPLSAAPQLNAPVRRGTGVRVYTDRGTPFTISEDHPSIYGSHLLGHEGERGAYYYYREATEAEVADLAAAEQCAAAERAARANHQRRVHALAERIQREGERPDGTHEIVGIRYADTQTPYGTGEWFVLTDQHVWYCRNNGSDGDTWWRNNVLTGGAGAIGYRVARTPDLEALLAALGPNAG